MRNKYKQRIRENIEEQESSNFSNELIEEIPAIIIHANLERAVLENAFIFRRYVDKIFDPNYKKYILDLSSTMFLDSTFLGVVVIFLKKIKDMGGSLNVVINSDKLLILSQISSINNLLKVFPSVDAAIESIA